MTAISRKSCSEPKPSPSPSRRRQCHLPTEACRTYVSPGRSEYGLIVTVCPVTPTEKEGPQGHKHQGAWKESRSDKALCTGAALGPEVAVKQVKLVLLFPTCKCRYLCSPPRYRAHSSLQAPLPPRSNTALASDPARQATQQRGNAGDTSVYIFLSRCSSAG